MTNQDVDVDERLRREAEFHDTAAEADLRHPTRKFYAVAEESHRQFLTSIFANASGRVVLDYGCGTGSNTVALARHGAHVTGIDISPVSLEVAREKAQMAGVSDSIDLRVMNAEQLELPDDSYDRVCGTGILHHLDLRSCYSEIQRVLRPGGEAIFEEPLGHNPLINWYRRRTPHMRTPDEHPLRRADISLAREYFSHVEFRCYHLTSLAIVPLRDTPLWKPLYRFTEATDRVLMALIPPLRYWAWMCILILRK